MHLQPNLAVYAEPYFFLLLSFPRLFPPCIPPPFPFISSLHIIPSLFSFLIFLPLFPSSSLPFALSSCSSFSFSLLVSSPFFSSSSFRWRCSKRGREGRRKTEEKENRRNRGGKWSWGGGRGQETGRGDV
jgi:hypothetical protein